MRDCRMCGAKEWVADRYWSIHIRDCGRCGRQFTTTKATEVYCSESCQGKEEQ